jgi:hypothetical protein
MKLLLVGNGNHKHRGARYYDQCAKLHNGFTRNGHHVLFLSDRDIARCASPLGMIAAGRKYCNKFFLDVCANFKPDMILLCHADVIEPHTIERARKILKYVRVAQFNVDIIFNPHNATNINNKLDVVDATFITTAGAGLKKFSRNGKVVSFVPNIADASIEWPRCFEHADLENDVFWALRALKGSVENDRRIAFPLYLEANGVKIDYYGMNGKPLLYNAIYFETIAKSKMGVNISQIWTRGNYEKAADEDLYLYSSDRMSHYMGSGLLTFTTRDNKFEDLFEEDKELVFFSEKEELLEKTLYYKQNPEARQKIARKGWEKYHGCFNERLVAKYIMERTFSMDLSEQYHWPTECW